MDKRLKECQERIGYVFKDATLLKEALTHSSTKRSNRPSNERLEFLGDAVLGIVISSYLFKKYPEEDEGWLTQVKSVIVSSDILIKVTQKLKLKEFFLVGKGIIKSGTFPRSILANLFEAIVGAIYLDGGLKEARDFILKNLLPHIKRVVTRDYYPNYKSLLQEYVQKKWKLSPAYKLIAEFGPDHEKTFKVIAVIGKEKYATGSGLSKKEAEQNSAKLTLERLKINSDPIPAP